MATNTSPDNLLKPQAGDQIAPLETLLGSMQDSVQTALTNRNPNQFLRYPTLAALNAVPGTAAGQHATVYADSTTTNNSDYIWSGSAWLSASSQGVFFSLTPATGWSAGGSPNNPRAVLIGGQVTLYGNLSWAGGGAYATIATAPAALRPAGAARTIGALRQVSGSTMILGQAILTPSTGVIGIGTGTTGSLPASGSVYLDGLTWTLT